MFKDDIVWYINAHQTPEDGEEMKPFDNIQSRSLERKFSLYKNKNNDSEDSSLRFFHLGEGQIIDLEQSISFPYNDQQSRR